MRSAVLSLFLILSSAPTVAAQGDSATAPHPALWRVRAGDSTVYLFGSLHLLPKTLEWRTPEIDAAVGEAGVFVFEIPADAAAQTRIQALVAKEGSLPAGESLRALLPPAARADYDADLALTHVPSAALDSKRPWLASLILDVARIQQEDASAEAGADLVLMHEASAAHKEKRYLETVDQQIRLIVPRDAHAELEEFEASLKDLRSEKDKYADYLSAWATGDTQKLDALINGGLAEYPQARKLLLDDRNRAWVKQIKVMLRERQVFFVTVGAGHLVGKMGVPALLRAQGYPVDGP